jgi:hypothetical protein
MKRSRDDDYGDRGRRRRIRHWRGSEAVNEDALFSVVTGGQRHLWVMGGGHDEPLSRRARVIWITLIVGLIAIGVLAIVLSR